MEWLFQKALESGGNEEITKVLNEHAGVLNQHSVALSNVNMAFWLLLMTIAGVGFSNLYYAWRLEKRIQKIENRWKKSGPIIE